MVNAPSIDALRTALAPVEDLRGEQSELETWVRESFSALDTLHGELSEWQRELTRQQAVLDQREAALGELHGRGEDADLSAMKAEMARMREESRQLEDENAEQLQTLDDLERQLIVAQTELRFVRKHTDEMTVALETERTRTTDEHRQWTGELQELRRLLERQGDMVETLVHGTPTAKGGDPTSSLNQRDDDEESGPDVALEQPEAAARTAELRRRANSRRAAHRRQQ